MITATEYQSRRTALTKQMVKDSVAIIPGANEVLRNGDSHYRFRQHSDFYYLTGFEEANAVLVLIASEKPVSLLFNHSRDPAIEQWTGRQLGQEDALTTLLVDEAYPVEIFSEKLPSLLADKAAIYYTFGRHPVMDNQIISAWDVVKKQYRTGINAPKTINDLATLTDEMRLIKSEGEIKLIKQAASISVAAHKRAFKAAMNAKNECELEAELMYEFTRQGCRYPAYSPIVGSGSQATVLHYGDNNQPIQDNDLILIDAGGEYQNYASDITRTFPARGTFTAEQKAVYEWVLKAQKAGIECISPGRFWHEIQATMVQIITEGLVTLGLLTGSVSSLIEAQAYRKFYMHNSGHWLGLDVHDCGSYKVNGQWRAFEPGMVLTVEPGIYIHPDLQDVDQKWLGIGIRIEDDILVTGDGYQNLTADLPVEIDEIEAFMRG